MNSTEPIFIAGTGRSGTTQLNRVLGQHPDVFSLPIETRFLVDPGGLEDLARGLTETYTPLHAIDAFQRFDRLMRQVLPAKRGSDGRPTLPEIVGESDYYRILSVFLDRLEGSTKDPAERGVPRFFLDRSLLLGLMSEFVAELFGKPTVRAGKVRWCEKTPLNLLSLEFLWELFPRSTVIHVTRDPKLVVASLLEQDWAPSSIDSTIDWLEPIYRRWSVLQESESIQFGSLIQLKLEDLGKDWPGERKKLFDQIGLSDFETSETFTTDRVESRLNQLTTAEEALVNRRLNWAFELMGYES